MICEIKVSVIIPVYNVENYVRMCVDSVRNQSLREIEIICVDDGSTDSCGTILDEYAEKDSRIRVIHQKNGGYGKALNTGFAVARGEYLGIVESDDYVKPEMYETLYQEAYDKDLDVVKSDYYKFFGQYVFRYHKNSWDSYYDRILPDTERACFFEFDMFNWTGIYKRSFIQENKILHTETPGASYQDTGFWLKVMTLCRRIEWISQAFYMYRQDNMLCSTKSRGKMLNHKIEYDLFEKEYPVSGVTNIVNLFRLDIYRFDFYRIAPDLRKEFAEIILEDYIRVKDRLFSMDPGRLESVRAWYLKLEENPSRFCENVLRREKQLLAKINRQERVILYGTGARGMEVYTKLKELGVDGKILFAVNSNPATDMFFDKALKGPECLKKEKDVLILICVVRGTAAFSEIEHGLQKMGIENYCDTEGICSLGRQETKEQQDL